MRILRKEYGVAALDVSHRLYSKFGRSITPQAILAWERGATEPLYSDILKVANIFKVPTDHFKKED